MGDIEATTYILALTAACARRSIQEVLLQSIANSASKLRASTAQHAITVVASICIVALSIATHDGLALLIPRGALSTSTLQAATAVSSVRLGLVLRAVW